MIVSEADSQTVACFCLGLGWDFVVLVNSTLIPSKWQKAGHRVPQRHSWESQVHSPPVRDVGRILPPAGACWGKDVSLAALGPMDKLSRTERGFRRMDRAGYGCTGYMLILAHRYAKQSLAGLGSPYVVPGIKPGSAILWS